MNMKRRLFSALFILLTIVSFTQQESNTTSIVVSYTYIIAKVEKENY